ncbi:MAG: elements of external origin [Verminephrobacter sp.]|jgi:hypothetical protein|nr:elements of external origin [Verminephrobacter sp.]
MTTHASKETVAARLAQLPYLPMENIWALWDQYFDRRPGHHHRTWLESRLAYKIQEEAFGAMSSSLKRRLEKIGETGEVPNQKRRAENQLAPGATLIREYNGIAHQVKVLDDGRFEYQARAYKSLSGVAKAITGTAWSGPAFFGLRQPAPKRQGALA